MKEISVKKYLSNRGRQFDTPQEACSDDFMSSADVIIDEYAPNCNHSTCIRLFSEATKKPNRFIRQFRRLCQLRKQFEQ